MSFERALSGGHGKFFAISSVIAWEVNSGRTFFFSPLESSVTSYNPGNRENFPVSPGVHAQLLAWASPTWKDCRVLLVLGWADESIYRFIDGPGPTRPSALKANENMRWARYLVGRWRTPWSKYRSITEFDSLLGSWPTKITPKTMIFILLPNALDWPGPGLCFRFLDFFFWSRAAALGWRHPEHEDTSIY